MDTGNLTTYWTIQTKSKWQEVQTLGYLTGNRAYVDEDFAEAYHWMMMQMKERIPGYAGEYPVWLRTERPDLRRSGYLAKGEQGVLLKVTLDAKDVLLSDFQAWHIVLNNCYMSLELDEDELYTEEEIRTSWTLIFELEQLKASEIWGEPLDLQGVTGKVLINQLTCVKEFIAR
ncbi:MAG: DUF3841 domain-containing protein [Solibacillus sp.]